MITRETVFILGAGASVPYGYPTGNELRNDICRNFEKRIVELTKKDPESSNLDVRQISKEAREFTNVFFKSSTLSIDLFLARNKQFAEIGKKAIVLSILEAERDSRFREDMSDNGSQDWYSYLFQKMTEDLISPESYDNFDGNLVTFITFNYDRSLEHFLYESLSNAFRSAPKDKIIKQLRSVQIFHVYGIVEKLPWQGGKTEYGNDYSIDYINGMKDSIRLINERTCPDIRAMEVAMHNASRFYFLGFGYADENIDVLGIRKIFNGDQKIYGTALGFTQKEIDQKRGYLSINFRVKDPRLNNPRIQDVDCRKLLRDWL
jgi:hypothetical protein